MFWSVLRAASMMLALASCGRIGFDSVSETADGGPFPRDASDTGLPPSPLLDLTVVPAYPSQPSWHDYVRRERSTSSAFDQPGVSCDGSERGGPSACIHSGELRRVEVIAVPSISSCTDVTARDELGVFSWQCRERSDGIELLSTLQSGRGLRHLVFATGWHDNRVFVERGGVLIGESWAEPWWADPVVPLPDNNAGPAVALDRAGVVYSLAETRGSAGYNIDADRIAVVTLPGATLRWAAGSAPNTSWAGGELVAGDSTALLTSGSQSFVWLEGDYDGSASVQYGIFLRNGHHERVRGVRVTGVNGAGLLLRANETTVSDVVAANNGGRGLWLHAHQDGYLRDVAAWNNRNVGIACGEFCLRNTFTRIVAANQGVDRVEPLRTGLSIGGSQSTFHGVVGASNSGNGVSIWDGSDNTLSHVVTVNNGWNGIVLGGAAERNTFSNIATAHNGATGAAIWIASSGQRFTNLLFVEGTGHCGVLAGTIDPGLGAGCVNAGLSDADIVAGVDLTRTFVGGITVDDARNSADAAGSVNAGANTDWTHFEHVLRGWGRDGVLMEASSRGLCAGAEDCRIWDFRLDDSDVQLSHRSADGRADNPPFVPRAPCPPQVHGDRVLTDGQGNVFLVNAAELVTDGRGDDDGLCESDERCEYLPHIGPQLDTAVAELEPCIMQDGVVSGVSLLGVATP